MMSLPFIGRPSADREVEVDTDEATTPGLESLLVRSAAGDEQAFAAFYDATASRLHGIVLRVLRDPAQAEEVTQEVFLQIWRESARFDPERGHALGWSMSIAHRRAVDRVRSSEASRRRDQREHDYVTEVEHDTTSELAVASVEGSLVRAAMAALTPEHRTALSLAYFDGLTHTEVATALGIPLGTAKTRIRAGLQRLRDLVTPDPLDTVQP